MRKYKKKKEDIQNHLIYKCLYKKKTKSILMCNKRDCKKVLNGINNYICKKCRKSFCLPHRYSDVHNCIKSDEEKSFFKSNIKKNKYILKLFIYILTKYLCYVVLFFNMKNRVCFNILMFLLYPIFLNSSFHKKNIYSCIN
ncbi:hypothetical protein PFHG_02748 [Plasmodium falciparum HB3]|uniref:AN1-type domain-containing protein n=2 Tax=Plasmodium falciparum TaxID=5833 RepID=A0A0L7M8A0_PLAF4|nr:hypothetical protein PFHG_02748 [Plasmodium falciparum HB3]KOB88790.1 hypothetical protein PFDG_03608 [Plasmodium falciparum Dd2]